jgi:hypothetical protein
VLNGKRDAITQMGATGPRVESTIMCSEVRLLLQLLLLLLYLLFFFLSK